MTFTLDSIECADALAYLKTLPDGCVHCVVTSVPYFNLRDYKVDGQIGLEDTPQAWVASLVKVFAEAKRVLRDDGTLWVNCGDSYGGSSNSGGGGRRMDGGRPYRIEGLPNLDNGLPAKSLLGQPWRLAFALQDDGWILRSDIIWAKTSVMPESVTDRPTKSHEHIFLFVKRAKYWYDAEAVREPHAEPWRSNGKLEQHGTRAVDGGANNGFGLIGITPREYNPAGRNLRDVWTINPEPSDYDYCLACNNFFSGPRRKNVHHVRHNGTETKTCPVCGSKDAWVDHYAAFPSKLVTRCLLAGCPPQVCAECGKPWVRVVERQQPPDSAYTYRGAPTDGFVFSGSTVKGTMRGRGQKLQDWHDAHPPLAIGWRATCDCNAATDAGIALDFFMGSGTTSLAARDLGRHYIGCDLSPSYVALSLERLAAPFTLPMPGLE